MSDSPQDTYEPVDPSTFQMINYKDNPIPIRPKFKSPDFSEIRPTQLEIVEELRKNNSYVEDLQRKINEQSQTIQTISNRNAELIKQNGILEAELKKSNKSHSLRDLLIAILGGVIFARIRTYDFANTG